MRERETQIEHLSSAVAAQPLQMLPVGQVARQTTVLQRDTRVNKGRSSTVVVHKERLREREEEE